MSEDLSQRPEGFQRVARALAERGHPHAPQWLDVPARTCAEAAAAYDRAIGLEADPVVRAFLLARRILGSQFGRLVDASRDQPLAAAARRRLAIANP